MSNKECCSLNAVNQKFDTGRTIIYGDPNNPISVLDKEVSVEDTPAFKAAVAAAVTQAGEKAKSEAGAIEEADKKAVKAESMIGLIDQANTLLDNASGSMAGAGISGAKGMLGISDETTQANQQLKLISGWMVANVPRMEGPQSDFDVKNYETMAAKVGDATVPIGDRKAALLTLKELQSKYSQAPELPPEIEVTRPEGIDPEDWEFMTPEERLLFQ